MSWRTMFFEPTIGPRTKLGKQVVAEAAAGTWASEGKR